MYPLLRRMFLLLTFLCALPLCAAAQTGTGRAPDFSDAELDQMLAPIALYPDQLLTQILMAATYPLEVVQAARWSRAHPGLRGQAAVEAADEMDWDPSVTSLVAFPDILAMMDQKLEWTEDLGDAFLAQEDDVMDRVQYLRRRAEQAGNLQSGEHIAVVHQGPVIVLRSAYPDVIYVPYYDPLVVYGNWWWPHYRPVYWSPWVGYRQYHRSSGFYWGVSINIGSSFFFGTWDWPERHVRIVERPPFYYRRPPPVHYVWVHDYEHRRGVRYRDVHTERRYVNDRPYDDHYRDARPQGGWEYRDGDEQRSRQHTQDPYRTQTAPERDQRTRPDGRDDTGDAPARHGNGKGTERSGSSGSQRWTPQPAHQDRPPRDAAPARDDQRSGQGGQPSRGDGPDRRQQPTHDDRSYRQPQPAQEDRSYRQSQPAHEDRSYRQQQPVSESRPAPEPRQQWQPHADQPRHETLRGGGQERAHGGGGSRPDDKREPHGSGGDGGHGRDRQE